MTRANQRALDTADKALADLDELIAKREAQAKGEPTVVCAGPPRRAFLCRAGIHAYGPSPDPTTRQCQRPGCYQTATA